MAIESLETLISTILTASITGAGLILAVYALIIPISKSIFEKRLETMKEKIEEFERTKKGISPQSPPKDVKQLTLLAQEIKAVRTFPRYLGPLVILDFGMFILSTTSALGWLLFPAESGSQYIVFVLFLISVLLFLLVGVYAIADVYSSMRADFEGTKKEKEEIERARKELEARMIASAKDYISGYVFKKRAAEHPEGEDNDK